MNTNDENDVGVVFRKTLGHYTVHTQGRELDCSLSSLIHKQLIFPTADPTSLRHAVQEVREIEHVDPVAIGDRVRYVEAGDGRGMIVEVLPRDFKTLPPRPGARSTRLRAGHRVQRGPDPAGICGCEPDTKVGIA